MVEFVDEFGARIFIVVQVIKCFRENRGPYSQTHKTAKSVIEDSYGELYYLRDTVDEIAVKLFGKKES